MTQHRLFGILNIHKPAGLTSRRVVDRVAQLVKPAKAGHAGTLDPMATGVLVVCVGAATRLIPHIQRQAKQYRAKFLLGRRSDTDDISGKVSEVHVRNAVTRQQVEQHLPRFLGTIEQVPPQFSAVHVNGKRAYRLARRGQRVDIQPKTVHVHRIDLIGFVYPELELEIACGSGTYVRSIGRDLGNLLECGAVMSELIRTRIGPYQLAAAVELDRLRPGRLAEYLLPATTAVADLPTYVCRHDEVDAIRNGRQIRYCDRADFADEQNIVVLTPEKQFACLAQYGASDQTLAPKLVFLPQV